MKDLIETIAGHPYSRIHSRAFQHDGCVVDLGCYDWLWSNMLIQRKRVIGADPFETRIPNGAELFKGVVTSNDCLIKMNNAGLASQISNSEYESLESYQGLSWKSFCKKYNIDKVSILKMNIEGAEYPLLHSMDSDDFLKIDQLIISFHDWMNPNWKQLTDASMYLLKQHGFKTIQDLGLYGWHMLLK